MGQAIGAAQIDKGTEVGELVDTAAEDVTGLKLSEQPLLLGLAPLLGRAAL